MNSSLLSVREMEHSDIKFIIEYWLTASAEFLQGMGVDTRKIPSRETWMEMLGEQLNQTYQEKNSYCLIWTVDDQPAGHSNVNKIKFGEEAYMHLHLWRNGTRKKGYGEQFVRKSLPYFFKNLTLKKICCEPYALNPAPNKVLEKVGFKMIKEYQTTPGWLNFEQPVKHWEMSYAEFSKMNE